MRRQAHVQQLRTDALTFDQNTVIAFSGHWYDSAPRYTWHRAYAIPRYAPSLVPCLQFLVTWRAPQFNHRLVVRINPWCALSLTVAALATNHPTMIRVVSSFVGWCLLQDRQLPTVRIQPGVVQRDHSRRTAGGWKRFGVSSTRRSFRVANVFALHNKPNRCGIRSTGHMYAVM